jgi:hypothetical protein
MKKSNGVENVDDRFDKAERIWDRLQKLLLKIVGGIVGISLAVYIAYGQLKEKHAEHFEKEKIEHSEALKKAEDKKHNNAYYNNANNNPNTNHDVKQQYLILSRLQSDCEYFLGNGNRTNTSLFHGNVIEHIKAMKELWIKLDTKPTWLSMKDIIDYERKMRQATLVPNDTITVTDTITDTVVITTSPVIEEEIVETIEETVIDTPTPVIETTPTPTPAPVIIEEVEETIIDTPVVEVETPVVEVEETVVDTIAVTSNDTITGN